MNINWGQVLGVIVLIGGVLGGASSQLSDLGFGPAAVNAITAGAGLVVAICGAFVTKFQSTSSQAQVVADHIDDAKVKSLVVPAVAGLEGVEHVRTNDKADETLKELVASTEGNNVKVLAPKNTPLPLIRKK